MLKKFKGVLVSVGSAGAAALVASSPAMADATYTVPTIDLTNFYAFGTLILAAGAGVFIFKKVRRLIGF